MPLVFACIVLLYHGSLHTPKRWIGAAPYLMGDFVPLNSTDYTGVAPNNREGALQIIRFSGSKQHTLLSANTLAKFGWRNSELSGMVLKDGSLIVPCPGKIMRLNRVVGGLVPFVERPSENGESIAMTDTSGWVYADSPPSTASGAGKLYVYPESSTITPITIRHYRGEIPPGPMTRVTHETLTTLKIRQQVGRPMSLLLETYRLTEGLPLVSRHVINLPAHVTEVYQVSVSPDGKKIGMVFKTKKSLITMWASKLTKNRELDTEYHLATLEADGSFLKIIEEFDGPSDGRPLIYRWLSDSSGLMVNDFKSMWVIPVGQTE